MDAQVTYDVKELLQDLRNEVQALRSDVNELKFDYARRSWLAQLGSKSAVLAIGVFGVIVNIPMFMFYLGRHP